MQLGLGQATALIGTALPLQKLTCLGRPSKLAASDGAGEALRGLVQSSVDYFTSSRLAGVQ